MGKFDEVVRMCDIKFDASLFKNFLSGNALDWVLSSSYGLPCGVNYMVIGDPGVGKTTIILDCLQTCKKKIQN